MWDRDEIAKAATKDADWRYDLEEEEFVCEIIQMAQAVYLWDGGKIEYVDLLKIAPHRAYVIAIEYRTLKIVDRFKSLNVLDRMLAYDGFPIPTSAGTIRRDQWIRITLDVLLSRLTSIRDCCFLFAAEIYELGLDPRDVNLKLLKKEIGDSAVLKLLGEIAEAARDVRDERDRHLHRGEERALAGDMDMFLKLAAMSEPNKPPKMGIFSIESGNTEVTVDLNDMHAKIASDIRGEYHEHGDALIRLARELFDAVDGEFIRRWRAKRDVSTDVRDWEKG